jgi:hypothetical protein
MTLPWSGGTEWAAAQASPWVAVNDSLRKLDAGAWGAIIEDRDLSAPPGSCIDGGNYIVSGTGTGAWAGHDGEMATAMGTNASNGWVFRDIAFEGFHIFVRDEDVELRHNGSSFTAYGPREVLMISLSDETTPLTTGTAKKTIRMPYAFTVTAVRASLVTAQTSGSIVTVDINGAGPTSILSTKLTFDNGEKTTTTGTPAVISDASLADDEEVTFDIDQVGDGTATGLKVSIIGYQT